MTLAENQTALPKISPSSQLRKKGEPISGPFQFGFHIHSPSGALLFLPDSDAGYLEVVRGSQHREPESHIDQSAQQIVESISCVGRDIRKMTTCGVLDKDSSTLKALEPLAGQSPSILFPQSRCREREKVAAAKAPGIPVIGYGASRGTTTLSYALGIVGGLDFIIDGNKAKQGLYAPVSAIPVHSPDVALKCEDSRVVVLAWQRGPQIVESIRRHGMSGRILTPFPAHRLEAIN